LKLKGDPSVPTTTHHLNLQIQQTMRPQHLLLASAAAVAPQSPSTLLLCVSAFSSSSIRSSSSKSSRKTSLLRWTEDKVASSSQQALLLSEEVVNNIQCKDNLGRSTPSSTNYLSMSEAESAHGMPWMTSIGRTEEVDPLLYMPFWTWQMDYMKATLTNLHPIDCTTSTTGLDVSYNENTDKRARIVNHCYASDESIVHETWTHYFQLPRLSCIFSTRSDKSPAGMTKLSARGVRLHRRLLPLHVNRSLTPAALDATGVTVS